MVLVCIEKLNLIVVKIFIPFIALLLKSSNYRSYTLYILEYQTLSRVVVLYPTSHWTSYVPNRIEIRYAHS